MSNRLANSTSPYLLQHADNPVDWYPWGEEAFAAAQAADRPIFLSIGYSSCHWCHVMAHESFEDAGIAAQLRESFISIKVDREERPDIDSIYMTALQIFFQMIGAREGGGWPLSMFLTPDGKPFYGGTYWPPVSKYGRPGFGDVLTAIAGFWRDRRQDTLAQAEQLTAYLRSDARGQRAEADESEHRGAAALADIAQRGASFVTDQGEDLLRHAAAQLERNFDPQFGGFGAAPKFPHPLDLRLLLRLARRFQKPRLQELALFTLDKMARGGIFDQLGGGFHRYSVDAQWLVPHFEKMLYDNAMLATAYLEAHQSSGRADLAEVAQATLDYLLREMTDPAGGFYSAQDADSEGVEGEFFVWTPVQIADVLGEELAARFCSVHDVSESGNFEGRNIPHRAHTWEQSAALLKCDVVELRRSMAAARQKLLAARDSRIKPGLDDKVLVNWNALAIEAFALGGLVLRDEKYLAAARNAADFILAKMRTDEGRLWHAWREGDARYAAYLDDYACLIAALQRLFEATQEERYVAEAVRLAEVALRHFADPGSGTFFYTADDHENLIARQKDAHDNPTPSGNGMLAMALARLGQLTGRDDFRDTAVGIMAAFGDSLRRMPGAMAQLLLAVDWELGPTQEVVVTAPQASSAQALLRDLQARFAPHCVFVARGGDQPEPDSVLAELLAGKSIGEEPLAYVCQGFACQAPAEGAPGIAELWAQLASQNFR